MYLEYRHPTRGVIRTSRIREIRELPTNSAAFFEGYAGRGHGYSASASTAQLSLAFQVVRFY
jgi:hypothetical protein